MTRKRSDQPNNELCQFPFADGRRCLMLRHPKHPQLCPFHAQAELQILESRSLGAEISATLTGHFITSADVVHILGKVFTAFAQDRIPQKKAATLAYLGQVMLHSMPQVASETEIGYSYETWCKLLDRSVYPQDSQPVPAAANPHLAATNPPSSGDTPPSPTGSATTPAEPAPPPKTVTPIRPTATAPAPHSAAKNPRGNPSESALPQNPPLTPVESALTTKGGRGWE